jgi:hypothetical protein
MSAVPDPKEAQNEQAHESGTFRYRHWLDGVVQYMRDRPRLKDHPTLLLIVQALRNDLDEYDKMDEKRRQQENMRLKIDEAFENGYKTLIASVGAASIAFTVWWYSQQDRSEVSSANIVPTLIAFLGTLAPILLSFFIFARAWIRGKAVGVELKRMHRKLNVHVRSVCTAATRLASVLNEMHEIELDPAFKIFNNTTAEQKDDIAREVVRRQREALDGWMQSDREAYVRQQVLSIHELLSSEEYKLGCWFRFKRFCARSCCDFQPSYNLTEVIKYTMAFGPALGRLPGDRPEGPPPGAPGRPTRGPRPDDAQQRQQEDEMHLARMQEQMFQAYEHMMHPKAAPVPFDSTAGKPQVPLSADLYRSVAGRRYERALQPSASLRGGSYRINLAEHAARIENRQKELAKRAQEQHERIRKRTQQRQLVHSKRAHSDQLGIAIDRSLSEERKQPHLERQQSAHLSEQSAPTSPSLPSRPDPPTDYSINGRGNELEQPLLGSEAAPRGGPDPDA